MNEYINRIDNFYPAVAGRPITNYVHACETIAEAPAIESGKTGRRKGNFGIR